MTKREIPLIEVKGIQIKKLNYKKDGADPVLYIPLTSARSADAIAQYINYCADLVLAIDVENPPLDEA